MDKTNKILIIGRDFACNSTAIKRILAERGLTLDDVILIDLEDVKSVEEAFKYIKGVPSGELLIEDVNSTAPSTHKIHPSKDEVLMKINNTFNRDELKAVDIISINKHPFDKFITKRGKKW